MLRGGSTYTDYGIEHNKKDPKLKDCDVSVTMSEYQNTKIFLQKEYTLNWSEGLFL